MADLPVAPTQAGAILMHRLLEQWPADKLMICTPFARTDCPLPGVRKIQPPKAPFARLFYSRVAYEWMTLLTLVNMAGRRLRKGRPPRWLAGPLREFQPEAVLTVSLAGAWMEADAVAEYLKIPLHLIIHDDNDFIKMWIPSLRQWGEGIFAQTYRRAASRLCISRPMETAYRQRFGVPGEVLLPSRGRGSVFYTEPRAEGFGKSGKLKVFYAGSIYGRVFNEIRQLGDALAKDGHRLILYTPSKNPPGLNTGHLEIRAPLPSSELIRRLHEEADLLLLLTSFEPELLEIMRTQFPSKLVDYTAAAVPILFVAPKESCIAAYLLERPDMGSLIYDSNPTKISAVINCMASSPKEMLSLARAAVKAGHDDFGYEKAYTKFCHCVSSRKIAFGK